MKNHEKPWKYKKIHLVHEILRFHNNYLLKVENVIRLHMSYKKLRNLRNKLPSDGNFYDVRENLLAGKVIENVWGILSKFLWVESWNYIWNLMELGDRCLWIWNLMEVFPKGFGWRRISIFPIFPKLSCILITQNSRKISKSVLQISRSNWENSNLVQSKGKSIDRTRISPSIPL